MFALHTKWSQDQVSKVLGRSEGDTKFIIQHDFGGVCE